MGGFARLLEMLAHRAALLIPPTGYELSRGAALPELPRALYPVRLRRGPAGYRWASIRYLHARPSPAALGRVRGPSLSAGAPSGPHGSLGSRHGPPHTDDHMTSRYVLRFETGERQGEIVPLNVAPGAAFSVGRKPGCSLQVVDASVSGRHAELTVDAGGVALRDLDSTNGVRVEGSASVRPRSTTATSSPSATSSSRSSTRRRLRPSTRRRSRASSPPCAPAPCRSPVATASPGPRSSRARRSS